MSGKRGQESPVISGVIGILLAAVIMHIIFGVLSSVVMFMPDLKKNLKHSCTSYASFPFLCVWHTMSFVQHSRISWNFTSLVSLVIL